jgi:uncharacterized SAM-binding protein YcdF (DUF218 family)
MYQFIVRLLEPHILLSLLVCLALFHLWRKRRDPARRLWPLIFCLVALAVVSMPVVVYLAVLSLESQYPSAEERESEAEAIVVFSAGLSPPDGPRRQAELDEDALQRCLHAAHLYAKGARPLLVSGGKVDADVSGPSPAAVMGDFLKQLGVKNTDLVIEDRSQSTYENAVECAKLLKERGLHRVLLVVDAVDMPRAALCLRKQGIEVLPAPCHYRATSFQWSLFSFLPSPGAARGFQRVWHEWLGLLWYRLRGRI